MIRVAFSAFGNLQWIHKMWIKKGMKRSFVNRSDEWARRGAKAVMVCMNEGIIAMRDMPNSGVTQRLKGFNYPLVESGELRKSVINRRLPDEGGEHVYYGGIDPDAVTKKGEKMTDLAMKQNNGYVIAVTEEIRNLFAANEMPLGANTKFLVVPPRPFLNFGLAKAMNQLESIAKKISFLTFEDIRVR